MKRKDSVPWCVNYVGPHSFIHVTNIYLVSTCPKHCAWCCGWSTSPCLRLVFEDRGFFFYFVNLDLGGFKKKKKKEEGDGYKSQMGL